MAQTDELDFDWPRTLEEFDKLTSEQQRRIYSLSRGAYLAFMDAKRQEAERRLRQRSGT